MADFNLNITSNHETLKAAAEALKGYGDAAKQADAGNEQFKKGAEGVGNAGKSVKKGVDEGTESLNAFQKRVVAAGGSAKMAAFGMTNSFNQLSDVFVTLAGGMNPLTVFIQQGPQLATAFGSVSTTLRVFLGFLTPVTVGLTAIAAASGYLAYQVYKDSAEVEGYSKALATMGNQAGITARALQGMADEAERNTGASSDNAEKAVKAAAGLATSSQQIKEWSEAALLANKNTGESVEDLVSKFARLSSDPMKALKDLGDQVGLLNPKLVEQVTHLVDMGDKTAATNLILDAYTAKQRQIAGTSGELKEKEVSTWDAITKSIQQAQLWATNYATASRQTVENVLNTKVSDLQGDLAGAQKQAEQERERKAGELAIELGNRANATALKSVQLTKERAEWAKKINDSSAQLTESQRKEGQQLLSNLDRQIEAAKKAEAGHKGVDKAAREAARQQAANIREEVNANSKLLDIQAQLKDLQEGRLKVTQQERDAAHNRNLVAQYELQNAKGMLNAEQQRALASMKANQSTLDATAAASRQLELAKENYNLTTKHQDIMQSQVDIMNTIGMSEQQRTIELEKQAQVRQRMRDNPLADVETVTNQVNAEYAKKAEARKAMDQDWIGGMKTGMQEWAEEAGDYASNVGSAVRNAMDMGTKALTDFVTTGKLNFKSFAVDILKMLAEMTIKMALFNALKAGLSGTAAGSAIGFAKGGVFQGEASLSAYRNQVVDRPTPFQFTGRSMFAKGGVFGEAGPEAIMPLSRDSNGRLGVKVEGSSGGGAGGVNIEAVHVSVSSSGDVSASASSERQDRMGRAYADAAATGARNEIAESLKPGGQIYEAMHAR